jgi:hypothetical protein
VLMRVVAQNLSPELTLVEKVSSWDLWFSIPKVVEFCIHPRHTVSATILNQVMTAHPDCATLDTTILDALHIMHDGKFLHIPVLDGGKLWFFHPKVASFDTSIVYLIVLFHEQMGGLLLVWTFCKLPMLPFQWSPSPWPMPSIS